MKWLIALIASLSLGLVPTLLVTTPVGATSSLQACGYNASTSVTECTTLINYFFDYVPTIDGTATANGSGAGLQFRFQAPMNLYDVTVNAFGTNPWFAQVNPNEIFNAGYICSVLEPGDGTAPLGYSCVAVP
jgi:hypothetical protein